MTEPFTMRRRSLGGLGLAALLGLAATRSAEAAEADSLTIAYPFDVPSWDPTASTFTGAQSLFKAVFDSPLQYSPDLKLMPRLVTAWGFQDAEKKRLEITLREGVLFHDGTPLTSEDVKYSIVDRPAKDPTLLIRRILPPLQTVEIVSPTKAVIVFTNPSPAAADLPGLPRRLFRAEGVYREGGRRRVQAAPDRRRPVQADPIRARLTHRAGGVRQVLGRRAEDQTRDFPDHHRPLGACRRHRVRPRRHGHRGADKREMTRLGALPGLTASANPFAQVVLLMMPSYVPAFQNENVRLAMQMSIDKAALSKAFYGGVAVPLSVLATPGTPGFVPGFTTPFDKTKAAALLKTAGFGPDNPLKFPFITTNGAFPNDFDVARAIAAMWRGIGIQVDIQEVSLAKYVDLNHSSTLPGPALYSWANPTGDPEDYTGRILDASLPFAAWKDPEVGARVRALMVRDRTTPSATPAGAT